MSSIDHNKIDHDDKYHVQTSLALAVVTLACAICLAIGAMLTARTTDPFKERNEQSRVTAVMRSEPTTDLVRHAETINVSESLAP